MTSDDGAPDPRWIHSMAELAQAFTQLRRRRARSGQMQLSVRDLARRTGRAPSTLHPYLRGDRLCPADVYESLLRALGVEMHQLRAWLDAWERLADGYRPREVPSGVSEPTSVVPPISVTAQPVMKARPRGGMLLDYTETLLYRVGRSARIGVITGDIRRVRNVDVWVNSENTGMQMARVEECSISAIIRFEGSVCDVSGRVVDDRIAVELAHRVAGRTPVVPGTAVVTGAGELARFGVRHVIHVAAVQGAPGSGYRQIADVSRCVTNGLTEAERLGAEDAPVRTILFPLLGVGAGGGDLEPTVRAMVAATLGHLHTWPNSRLTAVYFLASTAEELEACSAVLERERRLPRPPIRTP